MRVGQTRRRDATERAIVDALRHAGAFVVLVSQKGAPDLFVRYRGAWRGLEVKSGKGRVSAAQAAAGYPVVRSVEEALAWL